MSHPVANQKTKARPSGPWMRDDTTDELCSDEQLQIDAQSVLCILETSYALSPLNLRAEAGRRCPDDLRADFPCEWRIL